MGLFHDSNPSPPHNPAVKPPAIDTDDRGFFEEDDMDQRIWSVFDKNTGGSGASQGASGRPQPGVRPIPTTTRRPFVNPNSIDFEVAAPELEIEYPPEISDDRKNGNEKEFLRKEIICNFHFSFRPIQVH